ncbi:MAG TPA: hypothetical protein VNM70_18895, partial [Burkholderiales bacterium]|nr:hypothetical protein [Burkholderiales bacterium]
MIQAGRGVLQAAAGLALLAGGAMYFAAGGTAERMQLSAAGNLGIGMVPVNVLDITQSGANTLAIGRITNTNAGNAAGVALSAYNGANAVNLMLLGQNYAGTGLAVAGYGGLQTSSGMFLGSQGPMLFGTNNAFNVGGEKMRLDVGGNLGIGRTPEAWNPVHRVVAIGLTSALISENAGNGAYIGSNLWNDGAAWRLIGAAGGCLGGWGGGTFTWYTTPAGAANALAPLTEAMRLDINGRLGLATIPQATWDARYKSISLGPTASIFGIAYAANANTALQLTNNAFFDGATWRAMSGTHTCLYGLQDGAHIWYTSATAPGAGNPFNFAERMRLDNVGQLYVQGTRGAQRHGVLGGVATNAQTTMFKWPYENSNLSTSVIVKITAVNDDGNAGYSSVYREIIGNYSSFAGSMG